MATTSEGEMTLVFSLGALERLADPGAAVADARRWSEHIGVTGDAPRTRMGSTLDAAGLDPDVVSGDGGLSGSLAAIRQQFPTARHVFVGTAESDHEIAQALGWEYLPLREAAAKADWAVFEDAEVD